MFGIRDKKVVIPHMEDENTFHPGILSDSLFGLAGGLVIFLIVPGNFADPLKGYELIKFIAVAIVGGYGGRALVEKVLSQQIKDLEADLQKVKGQSERDSNALALLDAYFDDDPDTRAVSEKELRKAISKASHSFKLLTFEKARQFRRKALQDKIKGKKPNVTHKVIPIFEALIACDTENMFYRNHGQLGYALKDKDVPDWDGAKKELTKAIEIRNKHKIQGFFDYEFNRAVCKINTSEKIASIVEDLDIGLKGRKTVDWVKNPSSKYAPDLIDWLKKYRRELEDWIKSNDINV